MLLVLDDVLIKIYLLQTKNRNNVSAQLIMTSVGNLMIAMVFQKANVRQESLVLTAFHKKFARTRMGSKIILEIQLSIVMAKMMKEKIYAIVPQTKPLVNQ